VVYDVFQGNTYYLQKTFREAFAASVGGKTCDIAMVEGIIDSMIEESHHRYSETLARLTLAQKELLYAIVEEGKAQRITSGQFIKRHSLQSPSSVQAAMKKLMEYGIVTIENNEYSVEDQLFYRWLLNS
jgi:DNA-binding MarR family transcriptional regulator